MAKTIAGVSAETFTGLLLAAAAVLGLLFENIGVLAPIYDQLLGLQTTVAIGEAKISKPLLLWINDGLMAIFFFLVAMEIKREVKEGALSSWSNAALPFYGAIGGIVVPAIVFLGIVGIDSAEANGWAIPAATDIAFALGVLSLFGDRVPPLLKTFLLTLAVIDDLAAIAIIAVFYTADLSLYALGIAALCLAGLTTLNLSGNKKGIPYVILGLVLWVAVLKSGVHATLAGVALGFAIPIATDSHGRSLLKNMEHALHPWVVFMILPIFAFANAGVPLSGLSLSDFTEPLTMGIAAGLFFGKQIGIFGMIVLVVTLGLATRPHILTWRKLYAVSCLAGIGFTMSLFIGGLAFSDVEHQNAVRLGVLTGSIASGIFGAVALAISRRMDDAYFLKQQAMPAE
ncbi:MAG: Na+/H+ antiporter NhaA [Pseudomonadota bacterium]